MTRTAHTRSCIFACNDLTSNPETATVENNKLEKAYRDPRALAYFILPIDAIPDMLPAAGYTDDLIVLTAAN